MSVKEIDYECEKNSLRENFENFICENIDLFLDVSSLKFWLIVNTVGKFSRSSALTSGTAPNPTNWYPETDETIFAEVNQNEASVSDEDIEYYRENPRAYIVDSDDYIDAIFDDAWEEYKIMLSDREMILESRNQSQESKFKNRLRF